MPGDPLTQKAKTRQGLPRRVQGCLSSSQHTIGSDCQVQPPGLTRGLESVGEVSSASTDEQRLSRDFYKKQAAFQKRIQGIPRSPSRDHSFVAKGLSMQMISHSSPFRTNDSRTAFRLTRSYSPERIPATITHSSQIRIARSASPADQPSTIDT